MVGHDMTNQDSQRNPELETIMDLPVSAHIELGQCITTVGAISTLGEGGLVETQNAAGESLRLKIGDSVVALGEIVITEEGYGFRITRVLSAAERAKS
jgi:flagellar motor switch protein FliN/FliY